MSITKIAIYNPTKYRREPQPIKILNQEPEMIEFDTVEDFADYHEKHPDEFIGKTTKWLKLRFRIKGFTIVQQKNKETLENELCLKKESVKKPSEIRMEQLESKVEQLETKFNNVLDELKKTRLEMKGLCELIDDIIQKNNLAC
ncbi:MAG: hypothetical protein PHQ74_15260 [Crocinitomicaceae bacterium]|nr:hypothetical protein [Crocinitomicaceae bacterium]